MLIKILVVIFMNAIYIIDKKKKKKIKKKATYLITKNFQNPFYNTLLFKTTPPNQNNSQKKHSHSAQCQLSNKDRHPSLISLKPINNKTLWNHSKIRPVIAIKAFCFIIRHSTINCINISRSWQNSFINFS